MIFELIIDSMEKLELKHIIGYFPYVLKGISKEENLGFEIVKGYSIYGKNDTICLTTNVDDIDLELFKPILRPLSDLTKEIEVNGEKFVPIEVLNNMLFTKHSKLEYYESDFCKGAILFSTDIKGFNILSMDVRIQKLYEWHFDIHGLIEKNLAIDINTL